jgi:hypothetical protein
MHRRAGCGNQAAANLFLNAANTVLHGYNKLRSAH